MYTVSVKNVSGDLDELSHKSPYHDTSKSEVLWNFTPLEIFPGVSETPPDKDELLYLVGKSLSMLDNAQLEASSKEECNAPLGMEVGDDRVDLSANPLICSTAIIVQSYIFGMTTSVDDTAISSTLFNFCEVTSVLPCDEQQSFDFARRTNNFSKLGFIDTPPLRVIIDTTKVEKMHSTTSVGKASLLTTRVGNPNSKLRGYLDISSFLQDGYLRTIRSPDPKYLPNIMGGTGCIAPYRSINNLYLYAKLYRGGTYERLYGTATKELQRCVRERDAGESSSPTLCFMLRDRRDYLFGTYDNQVAIPPPMLKAMGKEKIPPPLYEAGGSRNDIASCETRLVRTKTLLTRTMANIELEKTNKINKYIFGYDNYVTNINHDKSKSLLAREKFGFALRANSAFQSLIQRKASGHEIPKLLNQGWSVIMDGQQHFTLDNAAWLFHGGKGQVYTIEDLHRSEDMFLRTDVSTEETLKVGGITLTIQQSDNTYRKVVTTTKVGLYHISGSMLDWAEEISTQFKSIPIERRPLQRNIITDIYYNNREWVNDDSLLIRRAIDDCKNLDNSFAVALVSTDRRLGNQMSLSANVKVLMIDPHCLPGVYPGKQWSSSSELSAEEVLSKLSLHQRKKIKKIHKVYMDTGSLAAHLSKLEWMTDKVSGNKVITQKTLSGTYYQSSTHNRLSVYTLERLEVYSTLTVGLFDPFDKMHKTRTRMRYTPYPQIPFDKSSWRSDPTSDSNNAYQEEENFLDE